MIITLYSHPDLKEEPLRLFVKKEQIEAIAEDARYTTVYVNGNWFKVKESFDQIMEWLK